jgi:uncharacterized membrane protein YdjX (TVP38/TMEM64 family)
MSVTKRMGLIVIVATLAACLYFLPLSASVVALVEWAQQHSVAGPLTYIIFVVSATVLFLPGSAAIMIGGYMFGFLPGLVFASIAIPLGAQCAFEVGRWVARPWVRRKVADNARMNAIEVALREQAFVIIILTRLSLIIPFNLLNYAYGATSVSARTHLLATSVGMLPVIGLYIYLGTVARDLSQIMSGQAAPSDTGYWIVIAGIVTIASAAWVVHRTASRVLQKHLTQHEGSQ